MPFSAPPAPRAWLLAVFCGVLAVGLRAVLQPLLGEQLPFLLAFVATMLSSLLLGWAPGLLTALVCAAAAASPVIPPVIAAEVRPLHVGGFMAAAVVITLACGQLGRTRSLEQRPAAGELADTPLTVWLRAVLWGAMLIPVVAFVSVAWWGYDRAERDARAAASHAVALAQRHAEVTLRSVAAIAERVDAATSAADDAVRADEAALHQRLADMRAGLPSLVNMNVWDAAGRALVGSDMYPVRRDTHVADRAYFRQQRDAPLGLGLSEVLIGRQTGRELLNVTLRRAAADGAFRGLVAVSVSPAYFRDYYRSLVSEQAGVVGFSLVRNDGTLLARWPPAPAGDSGVEAALQRAVAAGGTQGVQMLGAADGHEARFAGYSRLSSAPAYVTASFSRNAMFAEWARFLALLAAVLVPVTSGLVYVSWVSIQRTRREHATAVELREEIRRRGVAERGLLEQQRLETLSALTGGVAHDFNNLLAIVSTNLHLHTTLHPAQATEPQLQSIQRAVRSGTRLTRQLMSFARRQALRPETVLLQHWLTGADALLKSTLGNQVQWQVEVDPDTRPITVDLAELELAIINLALNARHALPDGGNFRLVARNGDGTDAGMVMLCAHDDGVGIPPEVLPRVLEPFFTTRDSGAGSGLGLSQVNGLCIAAGGHVRIDSNTGAGTVVRMLFPAATAPVPPPAPDEPPSLLTARMSGRVLVVEDNDEVAASTVAMLRGTGLDVTRMHDAQSALAHLRSSAPQPDAVLTDIAMPGAMSGIDLAFLLRDERPDLPVLLVTGYADQVGRATDAGFKVLRKPALPPDLLRELRTMLARVAAG